MGKVPADEVQARLAAAGVVYEQYLAADRLRAELTAAGLGPATASPAESSQLLCTWNAYALVSLAQAFIDAEGLEAGRPGFLPRVTEQQALVLLADVPAWLARAQRAVVDPGYDVATELALPTPLPPWVVVEPCPRSHVLAMQAAGRAMLERIEAELASLAQVPATVAVSARLRGAAAQAQSQLQSAAAILSAGRAGRIHESVEQPLRAAVGECYVLGQLLARPMLVQRLPPGPLVPTQVVGLPPPGPFPTGPGGAGYAPPYQPDAGYGYQGYGHHGSGHHGSGHHDD